MCLPPRGVLAAPPSARTRVHHEEDARSSQSPSSLPTLRCDVPPRPAPQALQASVGDTGQKRGMGA